MENEEASEKRKKWPEITRENESSEWTGGLSRTQLFHAVNDEMMSMGAPRVSGANRVNSLSLSLSLLLIYLSLSLSDERSAL